MIAVAYDTVTVATPSDCLSVISHRIEIGWKVIQLRGPSTGPFYLVFRKDDVK